MPKNGDFFQVVVEYNVVFFRYIASPPNSQNMKARTQNELIDILQALHKDRKSECKRLSHSPYGITNSCVRIKFHPINPSLQMFTHNDVNVR